ncbi:solute carrier family 16 member 6b [Poecilia latipinna]|uniref:Monocarboxylate transporter 7 n=2 Tax=Poecilia TaxID=8080 RepID=A0A3B3UJG6_9TELE|nr:PREDICTED: monocarboxylate transporter 7-like [Poecilia mexicana]XP_014826272.1 PREDICTED: monocarboxylate transporter 7-like [Poecilia mexicana]XP_014895530.1 PREDICTED: monocarboxylate transporter 7-like [Poecilia latipinna]XP_014895531.1 PREDICTED: monocarboxylate transporter 7-like [Poecilia latipinna]
MKTPRVPGCLGPNVYPAVPDGGWGWAVAMTFFIVEVNTYGVLKTLGVFLQDLMEEFQESNSRVSWVISISAFIFAFTAPVASLLSNRFGYRLVVMMGGFLMSLGMICSAFTSSIYQMYVTIGIISGFGFCLSFLPTVTILAQYFSRRRALVTAIASSGESFAIFAFAPAFSRLKQAIGWRCCLVVLGAMQASVVVFGILLRPISIEPELVREVRDSDSMSDSDSESASLKQQSAYELENEQTRTSLSSAVSSGSGDSGVTSLSSSDQDLRDNAEEASLSPSLVQKDLEERAGAGAGTPPSLLDFSMLKDAAFLWYCLFGLLATLGFFAPQLYIIELSKSRGVAPSVAPNMLSVMAVAEIVGRFSIGVVMNRVSCRKTRVLLGCVVVMAMVLLAFAVVWEFWGLAVCCALYGFFMGTVGSTHIPLLAEDEVVGISRMPACVGVYVFIQSFAGLAGPPLGGVLVDVTKNYGAAFYSCAAGMGLSAVCLALVGVAKSGLCHRTSGRENKEEEQVSQDNKPLDFLEVDLVEVDLVETSPVDQAEVV